MEKTNTKAKLLRLLEMRELSLLILLAAIVILLMSTSSTFATSANFRVVLQGMSVDMMIAIPMAISLLGGNIDFSVGSNLGLSAIVAGFAMNMGLPTWLGVLSGLVTGGVLGLFNAFVINRFRVIPMVATLGTWMAYRGITLVVAGNASMSNMPSSFLAIGRAEVFGVPITIVYMVVIILIGAFLIKKVNFFNQAYYIGSNRASARLAGINVDKFIYVTYMITGVVSAFAGMTLAARLGSANQNAGSGLEFRNVVALLVGGMCMDGGEGTILGVVLGVSFMQIVNNALVLLNINPNYTQIIIGFILILSVALDQMNRQRKVKL